VSTIARRSLLAKHKPGYISPELRAVYKCAGSMDVREITSGYPNREVLEEIRKQYEQVFELLRKMFKMVDEYGFTLLLQPTDILWSASGLSHLLEDECVLIRRLCEEDGHPVSFTENGLIVGPRSREDEETIERIFAEMCPLCLHLKPQHA